MDAPNATRVRIMSEDAREGHIPLAAGLHEDGTIHVYVHGNDSGLRIGMDPNGIGILITVDESARKLM